MKKIKILSALTAVGMLASLAVSPVSADELPSTAAETVNMQDIEINSAKTNFISAPSYFRYGNDSNKIASQGNAKLYKLNNVFGMGADEYGVEMVSREQRQYKPYMLMGEFNKEYSINDSFYIQANMYIGEERENDYFRLGGEYYDGTSRHTQYVWFQGNGRVQAGNRDTDDRYGAAYLPNNWYNVTLGYDKDTKKTSLYIDGKLFDSSFAGSEVRPYSVSEGIKNLTLGVRMEQRGTSDNGGLPSWIVMKDMRIVPEAYAPESSDTTISSSVYETAANSLFIQSSATADKAQAYVADVPDSITAAEFLANINAPTNAEKQVIKIDEYSKATIAVTDSDLISDDMLLLIKAADGSKKLYDIRVNVSKENLPQITSDKYTISNGKISVPPHTSVSALLNNIIAGEGTTVKLVGINGAEIYDGYVLTNSMSIIASKGANSVTYQLDVKDTYVLRTATALETLADNDPIMTAVLPVASAKPIELEYNTHISYNRMGTNSRFYGMGAGSSGAYYGTEAKDYSVVKSTMPTSGAAAYKVTTEYDGWIQHRSATDLASKSSVDKGLKTITNYKISLDNGASAVLFAFRRNAASDKGVSISDITAENKSDMLTLEDGKILLGGAFGNTAFKYNRMEIGTYEPNKEYDVTMVQKTLSAEDTEIVIEGIYLDGEKIFPTAENAAEDGFYHIDYNATTSVRCYALRSVVIANKGNVYWGDLNVYMADDFNIAEEPTVTDVTITSLDPAVEVYAQDPLANNMSTIKGCSGTVGDLRAVLDTPVGTELKVLDRTGSTVLNDNIPLEADMIVRVLAVNNSNVAYYILSDILNMGEFNASFAETMKVTRTISAYKDENINVSLALASYDSEGKMLGVSLDAKAVTNAGKYEFIAELPTGAESYKAMLIDNNARPYCKAAEYSKDGTLIQ